MGEEWTSRWGTATIFINGEKLGVLENESKTITMEQKQFNEGDKVLLNGNTENIYVISKVIHNYRGNGGCRYHLRKENEEYGSFLRFVRGSKLSACEEQQPKFKVGDLVRFNNDKVMKILDVWCEYTPDGYCVGFRYNCNGKHYSDAMLEPYSPKEGEFYVSKIDNTFISYSGIVKKEENRIENIYWTCVDCPRDIIYTWMEGYQNIDDNHRPATEEEKQTLIKAVEDKFNKTYCEKTKEWVDMKEKSDVKADKVEQGTMPRTMSFELGSISLTDLQSIAELAGWKPNPECNPSNADRFRQITKDMADLYERKNKDYGNSFSKGIERRGFGSAVDRLYDKVDRLNQLLVENKTAEVKDESVIDTLKDLANYSIMTILEVEKKKLINNEK